MFLLSFVAFTSLVSAQRVEINQETFLQKYDEVIKKTDDLSQKTTFTGKTFNTGIENDGKPQIVTIEFVAPDKSRTVKNTWSSQLNKYITTESFLIGNTLFEKKGDSWTKEENNEKVKPLRSEVWRDKIIKDVNWYLTENIEFENQKADLYEVVLHRFEKTQKFADSPIIEYEFTFRQKFWITKDNLLLKTEAEQIDAKPGAINAHFVYVYEYESTIKIEAPIK